MLLKKFTSIPSDLNRECFRDINILMGSHDLCYAVFLEASDENYLYHNDNIAGLLRDLKIFSSASEASRNGYKGPISKGYTQLKFKNKFIRITILN